MKKVVEKEVEKLIPIISEYFVELGARCVKAKIEGSKEQGSPARGLANKLVKYILAEKIKARREELERIFAKADKSRPVEVKGKITSILIGTAHDFIERKEELEQQLLELEK